MGKKTNWKKKYYGIPLWILVIVIIALSYWNFYTGVYKFGLCVPSDKWMPCIEYDDFPDDPDVIQEIDVCNYKAYTIPMKCFTRPICKGELGTMEHGWYCDDVMLGGTPDCRENTKIPFVDPPIFITQHVESIPSYCLWLKSEYEYLSDIWG